MNKLFHFLLNIISMGAIVTLSELISHKKLKTSVTFALGLAFSLSVFNFATGLLDELPNIGDSLPDITESENYEEITKSAFEGGIENYISEKYAITQHGVRVTVRDFDIKLMRADIISVTLDQKNADFRKIENDIRENFAISKNSKVTVEYKF